MTKIAQTPRPLQNIAPDAAQFFEALRDRTADATTTSLGTVKQAVAVADLNQTISNPPTQTEVQAISDKVDALLAALRTSGALNT